MTEINTRKSNNKLQLKDNLSSAWIRITRGYPVFHVGLLDYFSSRMRVLLFLMLQALPILVALMDMTDYKFVPLWSPNGFGVRFVVFTFNYYVSIILVIETLFFSLSITRDEIDRETISYWIQMPVFRAEIILWKYIAYVCFSVIMFFPATIILFFFMGRSLALSSDIWSANLGSALPLLVNALLIEFMAIVLYGALFFFFAIVFSKPMLPSLLVAFVDFFFANTPFAGILGAFSPASYHLQAITYQLQVVNFGSTAIHLISDSYLMGYENSNSMNSIINLTIICLFLTIFFFRRKDLHHNV